MANEYPDYKFPQAILDAQAEGLTTARQLLDATHNRESPRGLMITFLQFSHGNLESLLKHFNSESAYYQAHCNNGQGLTSQEARPVAYLAVVSDTCCRVIAQKIGFLCAEDEDDILRSGFEYASGTKGVEPLAYAQESLSLTKRLLIQYGGDYRADDRIDTLLRTPGILFSDENPDVCLETMALNFSRYIKPSLT